jgi:malonyl CoA-acyl carrier protein transacylase/ubiquinone/menaquinone biosynthesis C-methylase UbiE
MLEEASDDPQLLLYSAAMSEAVTRTMENHRAYLSQHAERIEDLAYTLATRREHLGHRGFVVASREKPGVQSAPVKPSPLSNIVMVFTGQGAQWPQMGKELLRSNRHFKSTIKAMDAHLKTFGADGPKWTIEAELRKPAKTSQVHLAELSQPLCTAIQVALVAALNAVGVKPAAVVGHSSGEIAAAYAAGALSAEQAITAAFHRGAVAKKQQRKGGMAAIGLSWDDVKPFLVPNVGVACENSAKSVTLSGDLEQVEAVVSEISKAHPNVLARLLKVEKAYHSYHMTEIGEDYYQMVGPKMFGQGLQLPFFSSVTGKLLEKGTLLGSRYWQSNLESPVLFRAAVLEILDHDVGKNALFLEIGPHSALAGPLRQIWSERSVSASYVGTLARGQESTEAWLNMLGKLYTLHIPLDLPALFPSGTSLTDLPRYPWDHSNQKWHETRATKEWRFREYAHHDLLGVRIVESTNYEPVWRNILHIDNVPWVRDHQIGEDILLPFTGYVAMAGEAIRQTTGIQEGFKIRQAAATSALALVEGQPIELISTLRKQRLATSVESDWWEFTVGSHNGTNWTKHFSGEIKAMVESIGPTVNAPELPRQVDSKGWHHASRLAGNVYGPRFQCQENIRSSTTSPGQATGIIKNAHQGDERNFHMHPATMDAGLQLMVVASIFGLTNNFKNQVATSVRELSVSRCAENLTASVIGSVTTNNVVLGSGDFSCNGQVVMRVADFVSTILDNGNAIDAHAAARHIWRADVDFADASELFKPYELKPENLQSFELMTTLCLARARQDIINITPPQYHLQKYKTWIESNIGAQEDYSDSIVQLQKIVDELAGSPLSSAAQALSRVSTSIASLVREEVSPSGVIGMDDSSDKMRTVIPGFDFTDFIVGIAHSRPNLRVLELGAGNGQSAIQVLKQLGSSFSKYTLTDFSSSLFESIKEQFKGIRNVEFVPLDIGLPLEDQGFGDRKFDLIIANNVFHQVADATAGMRNLRQLLHPQGRLLLQEPSRPVWSNFLFGSLPSWWKAADQLSAGQRLDPQSWNQLIAANDLDIHTEKSDSINRILVARPKRSLDISKEITVLRAGDHIDVSLIQARLEERGFAVSLATLESEPHVGRDVVSVLDLTGPFLHDLKPAEFEQLKKYLASVQDAGIFWITKVGSVGVADPRYADVLGFSRSFRNETNVALAVCQTDAEFDSPEVFAAFEKFHSRQEDEVFDSEMEYAVINGKISIGRFYPYSLVNELLVSEPNDAATLAIGRAGRLDGLHWKSRTAEPLGPKDVQIQVYCAGLNHRVSSPTNYGSLRQYDLRAYRMSRLPPASSLAILPLVKKLRVWSLRRAQAYNTSEQATECWRLPGML